MSPEALIRKARRASKSIVGGDKLLSILTSPPYIIAAVSAAEKEVPPVSGISKMLQKDMAGVVDLQAMPVRQFIGMTMKAILAAEGFQIMETGVKIAGDPIFKSGSTYERVEADDDSEDDLLKRIVNVLNVDELLRLRDIVAAAI